MSVKYSAFVLGSGQAAVEDETRVFRIGDGEIMPAVELVAKLMRVGEASEVRCDARFAFGDVGLAPHVAPGTDMKLVVELLRVGKKITAEMDSKELIAEAAKKKESGNRYFREHNYEQAAKLYKRALKLLESWEHEEEDEAACKALLIALGNNVGNVQHKLKQYKEARQSSLEVIQLDPTNVKAMYRVGQIALEQSDFVEATEFLRTALDLEPQNAKVRALLADVKRKKLELKQRERKLYAKLGGGDKAGAADSNSPPTKAALAVGWLRANPALVSTLVSLVIAVLMYQFVGKRFHGME